jgi:hypothetical protein
MEAEVHPIAGAACSIIPAISNENRARSHFVQLGPAEKGSGHLYALPVGFRCDVIKARDFVFVEVLSDQVRFCLQTGSSTSAPMREQGFPTCTPNVRDMIMLRDGTQNGFQRGR